MHVLLTGSCDLQGHRGARGKRPENTIPAFQYCIEHDMTTIELDTNLTKDQQLIVYHDTVLNAKICRHEDGKTLLPIPIKELTVAELKQLDCGLADTVAFPEQIAIPATRLLTLSEFFEFIHQFEQNAAHSRPIRFNIEIKFAKDYTPLEVKRVADLMVRTIMAADMGERSTVQSFVLEVLLEIKKLNKNIQTSALFEPGWLRGFLLRLGFGCGRENIIQTAIAVDADIISPHFLYINDYFIQCCHNAGKKVIPWVVNEETMMNDFLNRGVDGIISDYPDRLHRVHSKWINARDRIKITL